MTDSIQEQLANARRNQILDAAVTVFAQKGFHPTTIKHISAEAGIADGTIYNYFKNKPALLLGIFERMRDSIQQDDALMNLEEVDLRTFMRTFLAQPLIALRQDNFELFRVVVSEMLVNEEMRTLYDEQILRPAIIIAEQYFEKWAAQGAIKSDNVALAVRAISSMVIGLMVETAVGDPVLDEKWDELPDFLTDMLLDGLT